MNIDLRVVEDTEANTDVCGGMMTAGMNLRKRGYESTFILRPHIRTYEGVSVLDLAFDDSLDQLNSTSSGKGADFVATFSKLGRTPDKYLVRCVE